jgi:hypothetical protein
MKRFEHGIIENREHQIRYQTVGHFPAAAVIQKNFICFHRNTLFTRFPELSDFQVCRRYKEDVVSL